ncbi:SAM-dependent methyltransferase [Leptolyngbya sp. CCNP1308]|uniref:SAM-dependent methyltransferase n=1 Tax=Leptolyngbya sp. CCNP1308 TaxID=3110255 RepID=UPI002B215B5F|nr:SAM-dependent methyltransferase [Leptolyngbya sp. CCNP1308]MEA5449690.1 SAM-dependent methyltransferase [Leptolyngbya sp. CCNP1308]
MSSPSTDLISYTAQIVAAKRAIEQSLPVPLFNDPYAAALAGNEVEHLLSKWRQVAERQGRSLEDVIAKRTRYIAIRTRFLDDLLLATLPRLSEPQVVILGSGLDTRAYRLPWPAATRLYEVDLPRVLDYKANALGKIKPNCRHHLIASDLENFQTGWIARLLEAGLRQEKPTIWILEGVLMYLPEPSAHSLLRTVTALSSPGSVLGMDAVKSGSILAAQSAKNADRGRVVRHWQFGCDEPQQLLKGYGWSAEVGQPQDFRIAHGRYPESMPVTAEVGGHQQERGVWLVKARKDR